MVITETYGTYYYEKDYCINTTTTYTKTTCDSTNSTVQNNRRRCGNVYYIYAEVSNTQIEKINIEVDFCNDQIIIVYYEIIREFYDQIVNKYFKYECKSERIRSPTI